MFLAMMVWNGIGVVLFGSAAVLMVADAVSQTEAAFSARLFLVFMAAATVLMAIEKLLSVACMLRCKKPEVTR